MPDVIDNCAAEAIELDPIVGMDGQSGTIIRRFEAIDDFGNTSIEVFEQTITVRERAGITASVSQKITKQIALMNCWNWKSSMTDVLL